MPRMVLLHVWTSANFGRDFNLSRTLSVTCINSPSPSEVVLGRAPRCYWIIYAPHILLSPYFGQVNRKLLRWSIKLLEPYETAIDVPKWTGQHRPSLLLTEKHLPKFLLYQPWLLGSEVTTNPPQRYKKKTHRARNSAIHRKCCCGYVSQLLAYKKTWLP